MWDEFVSGATGGFLLLSTNIQTVCMYVNVQQLNRIIHRKLSLKEHSTDFSLTVLLYCIFTHIFELSFCKKVMEAAKFEKLPQFCRKRLTWNVFWVFRISSNVYLTCLISCFCFLTADMREKTHILPTEQISVGSLSRCYLVVVNPLLCFQLLLLLFITAM